jgi:hypothetical protein
VIIVSVALMRSGSNARHLAIRRMMLILFAVVAVLSIFFRTAQLATFFESARHGPRAVRHDRFIPGLHVHHIPAFPSHGDLDTKLARRIAIDECRAPRSLLSRKSASPKLTTKVAGPEPLLVPGPAPFVPRPVRGSS